MSSSDSDFQAINLRLITPEFGTHILERHSFKDIDHLDDDSELRIVVDELISNTAHSTVFRGKSGDRSFVVKTCYNSLYRKHFSNETRAYETLFPELQGEVIPKFYGYFKGFDDIDKSRISCIVLEDCGNCLDAIFERLPLEERLKILTALGKFHKSKFHPGDFNERNVVVRDGQYRLIDFHRLFAHECRWHEGLDWRPGDYCFSVAETIPCDVLLTAGQEMAIWRFYKNPIVKIGGVKYCAKHFPPQETIDRLVSGFNFHFLTSRREIIDWLKKVKSDMDEKGESFNIDVHIANPPEFPFPAPKIIVAH